MSRDTREMIKILILLGFFTLFVNNNWADENTNMLGKNLDISFRLLTPSVMENEPILVEFLIYNRGTEMVEVQIGATKKGFFEFFIKSQDGSSMIIPSITIDGFQSIGIEKIDVNENYSQVLILNEFLLNNSNDILKSGRYSVEAIYSGNTLEKKNKKLVFNPLRESTTFEITVTARDKVKIKSLCVVLLQTALESNDPDEAEEAANKLSLINDYLAVPYLAEMLFEKPRLLGKYAINGLTRINTEESIDILINVFSDTKIMKEMSKDHHYTGDATDTLMWYLRSIQLETKDPELESEIYRAFASFYETDLYKEQKNRFPYFKDLSELILNIQYGEQSYDESNIFDRF